jgi:hypothetical protein
MGMPSGWNVPLNTGIVKRTCCITALWGNAETEKIADDGVYWLGRDKQRPDGVRTKLLPRPD